MRFFPRSRLLMLAVAVAILAACAPAAPTVAPGRSEQPTQSGEPIRIKAVIRSAPTGLIQQRVQRPPGLDAILELVHAGLVQADAQGALHPRLAEAVPTVENGLWKLFPDGRMETSWRLRPTARWHDGTAITAEDLRFAVDVERSEDLEIPRNPIYDLVEDIQTPDPHTVIVHWSRPYVAADTLFALEVTPPLPRHLLEGIFTSDKPGFLTTPYWSQEFVGAGPYRIREWVADSHVLLQASDLYTLGRPRIDQIEVRFIPDPNTLMTHVLAGIELTLGRALSFEQALQLRDQWGEGRMLLSPGGWIAITPQFLNPTPPIVANLQFRRALLHAIDRQQLGDSLMAGLGSIAHTYMSPDEAEYREIDASVVRYDYDPGRAALLLEALGYRRGPEGLLWDGSGSGLSVQIAATQSNDIHLRAMPAVADYWKQVGVPVEQVAIPLQRLQDRPYRVNFPAFTLGLSTIGLTPSEIRRFHSTSTPLTENRIPITANASRYQSAELDALIERYEVTIPKAERMRILGQIVHHQTDRLTLMGLFHHFSPTLVANRLKNVGGRGVRTTEAWNAHEWDAT